MTYLTLALVSFMLVAMSSALDGRGFIEGVVFILCIRHVLGCLTSRAGWASDLGRQHGAGLGGSCTAVLSRLQIVINLVLIEVVLIIVDLVLLALECIYSVAERLLEIIDGLGPGNLASSVGIVDTDAGLVSTQIEKVCPERS